MYIVDAEDDILPCCALEYMFQIIFTGVIMKYPQQCY